jgi:hypothetical protein
MKADELPPGWVWDAREGVYRGEGLVVHPAGKRVQVCTVLKKRMYIGQDSANFLVALFEHMRITGAFPPDRGAPDAEDLTRWLQNSGHWQKVSTVAVEGLYAGGDDSGDTWVHADFPVTVFVSARPESLAKATELIARVERMSVDAFRAELVK